MIQRTAPAWLLVATVGATSDAPGGYIGSTASELGRAIPKPPVDGSPSAEADIAAYKSAGKAIGSAAWQRAIADRAEASVDIVAGLRCATRRSIDPRRAPATFVLLAGAQVDLVYAIRPLKQRYQRPRPYAGDLHARLCEPVPAESRIETSPSYPSGHATEAALTGYILASLLPSEAPAILARSRQYGESRVVCRMHFPSDVRAGQSLAAAIFAREQAEARFRSDSARARQELQGIPPDPKTQACEGTDL